MAAVVKDVAGATDIPIVGGQAGYRGSVKDITIGVYATGGVPVTAADLGLGSVVFVDAPVAAGYTFEYDYVNSKLKAFRGDNPNAAAAPGVEVSNAVDLSAVIPRVWAIGTPRATQ